jgi:hypothetical protein
MADFETELSGLFETEVDSSVGPLLASAAMARIQNQDEGRSLALTAAAVVGVAAAGSVVGASGAIRAIRMLAAEAVASAPQTIPPTILWPMAALIMAACAVQALRTARNL